MLVDYFPGQQGDNELREVLARRMHYLVNRAEISGHDPSDTAPQWQGTLAQATLWMEAAESAVAFGQYDAARGYLTSAARLLLRLRLPLGAALQRIFHLSGETLSEDADNVVAIWREALVSRKSLDERNDDGPRPVIAGAFDIAQQWGYYVLAKGGADARKREGSIDDDRLRARGVLSAPVGRLRLPLQDYFTVAALTGDAVLERDSRFSVGSPIEAEDVAGKSLMGLYRILQYASQNTYLWRRLLSPAPMFDLDTALLTARVIEAGSTTETPEQLQRYANLVSDQAKAYANEFVLAVENLRGASESEMRYR